MIDSSQTPTPLTSYAEAIRTIRQGQKACLNMSNGTTARINRTRLLQNYETILHCAGIEQMMGEAIGVKPGELLIQDADEELGRYADVPACWLPSLGELISAADHKMAIASDLLAEIKLVKEFRDQVLHGKQPAFGAGQRKCVKAVFQKLRQGKHCTPRAELLSRIAFVEKIQAGKAEAEETFATLETLYLSIEAESDVRNALPPSKYKSFHLPAVASIFELKRLDPALTRIFKRDNLARRLRASALIRNHLVHGSLITPTERQTRIIRSAHELLGQALVEFQLKKNGGHTAGGDFRNGLDL